MQYRVLEIRWCALLWSLAELLCAFNSRVFVLQIRLLWSRVEFFQDLSFLLAIIINFLILLGYGTENDTSQFGNNPECVCFSSCTSEFMHVVLCITSIRLFAQFSSAC
jgi:hypothetical protein